MYKRNHLAVRQDRYNYPSTQEYNYIPNLKEEIISILDSADLRNYAVGIVKLILSDKHRKIENHHAEIECIVNSWLRNKEYKIRLEHRHLDDIFLQQTKMKEQLDKMVNNFDKLHSIQYTVACLNIKVNKILEKDNEYYHNEIQKDTAHAPQAIQKEITPSRRSERKRAAAIKETNQVSNSSPIDNEMKKKKIGIV